MIDNAAAVSAGTSISRMATAIILLGWKGINDRLDNTTINHIWTGRAEWVACLVQTGRANGDLFKTD